jgi:hypothetical protein
MTKEDAYMAKKSVWPSFWPSPTDGGSLWPNERKVRPSDGSGWPKEGNPTLRTYGHPFGQKSGPTWPKETMGASGLMANGWKGWPSPTDGSLWPNKRKRWPSDGGGWPKGQAEAPSAPHGGFSRAKLPTPTAPALTGPHWGPLRRPTPHTEPIDWLTDRLAKRGLANPHHTPAKTNGGDPGDFFSALTPTTPFEWGASALRSFM